MMSALGPDGTEIQLPFYPRKRTQVGHRVMSEKGQFQKSRSYSIRRTKEARAYLRAYRLPGLTLRWTPLRGVSAFLKAISNQIP
jgi:hypothetical protein